MLNPGFVRRNMHFDGKSRVEIYFCTLWICGHDAQKRAWPRKKYKKEKVESAGKPGSVVDSHSSGTRVAARLKQPTRERRGPRHCSPIRSCSGWGLPCRPVARLAVRSYRTISPLPDPSRAIGGIFLLHFPSARAAQALPGTLPCGARTFLGTLADDATAWPTPPMILPGRTGLCAKRR